MAYKDPKKRFCFVYKTTNLINQKYYIGCHCTYKLDDGYLGSGTRIQRSISKYGRENFRLEILEFFETREQALAREKELVTEGLLNDPMCMNLQIGGKGGWSETVGHERQRQLAQSDPKWTQKRSASLSKAIKQAWKDGKMTNSRGFGKAWLGKTHKPESIAKMSQTHKGMAAGKKNGRFGSVWIINEIEQRMIAIRKEELESYLSKGWKRGRKFKWKVNPNGDGA